MFNIFSRRKHINPPSMGSRTNTHTLLFILLTISSTSAQYTFRCTSSGATCNALVGYVSPNSTTLAAIRTLFSIRNLQRILGANNLDLTTPGSYPIAVGQTVRIPFPCICNNGTGISNRTPNYTVLAGDGLYHIAAEVFSGLVTYPQIQAANNISDSNFIEVGQIFWIPLPCSCDDVDGQKVVHYGHSVDEDSTIEGIAQQFNTSIDTLLRLNNFSSPSSLLAGDILDVPFRACSSMINNNSQDYPLLVANGTYVFTANNCVQCRCNMAMNWMLQCEPTQSNSSCSSSTRCSGGPNLSIGNTATSGCNTSTCTYSGFNSTAIMTTLTSKSTCSVTVPHPNNRSSSYRLQHQHGLRFVIYSVLLIAAF